MPVPPGKYTIEIGGQKVPLDLAEGQIAADLLFAGPDSPDFRAGPGAGTSWLVDFVKKAQAAQPQGSQCPIDVDVSVMEGLPPDFVKIPAADRETARLFNQALAAARRDVIGAVLNGFGPSVRVTGEATPGLVSAVFISAQSTKDNEQPKLHTNSVPPKGKKVKAGDQIKVTMIARDHANLWQSGIKTIQLVAESEGGRFIASENFPPASPGCTALPPERRVEATYTVPSDPPLIVRLAALAEDHAGLMDTDIGEFPTGDFYGTMTRVGGTPPHQLRGHADFVLNHDGKGNLTGTMIGQVELVAGSYPWQPARPERGSCSSSTAAQPVSRLVGRTAYRRVDWIT